MFNFFKKAAPTGGYKVTNVKNIGSGKQVTLEEEHGGSYTLKRDDGCVVLEDNKTGKWATHFFPEAVQAMKDYSIIN